MGAAALWAPSVLVGAVTRLLQLTLVLLLQGVMQGTIPYLGTFLTDLVMLDTAMKDFLDVRTLLCVLLIPFSFQSPEAPRNWLKCSWTLLAPLPIGM